MNEIIKRSYAGGDNRERNERVVRGQKSSKVICECGIRGSITGLL